MMLANTLTCVYAPVERKNETRLGFGKTIEPQSDFKRTRLMQP